MLVCNIQSQSLRSASGPFLFGRGQPFELIISVEQDRYRVAVNGQPAFDFFHRAPLQEVERLNIQGDVDVRRIVFSGVIIFK